jgi:uncharacterized metal-binding protein YceD (DUF177 family)
MSEQTPEFSRVVRLDQTARAAAGETIVASEAERAALAERFGLVTLDSLEATYALNLEDEVLVARGQVRATLAQTCVATGEPVPETIDTPFAVQFLKESDGPQDDEMELSADECDTVFYSGDAIDLGEAVAETLALALEPFPRAAGADAYLKDMGVLSEEQASPFAVLLGMSGKGVDKDKAKN